MIRNVLEYAAHETAQGRKAVLLTVTDTHGSSPASPGQMMAVSEDGHAVGTVGGGASEHKLMNRAVQAIVDGERVFSFSFDHSEDGMVCGGGMSGYGNVLGSGLRLVIFGGGHVAQNLTKLAVFLDFSVTVVEDRPELSGDFDGANFVLMRPEEYGVLNIEPSDYAVICTRGHATDDDALRFCLTKPLRYLGMIGSKKKVATLFDRLRNEGLSDEQLNRVYAPVGLNIASSTPKEIAVSIMSEILMIKNGGAPNHKKLIK